MSKRRGSGRFEIVTENKGEVGYIRLDTCGLTRGVGHCSPGMTRHRNKARLCYARSSIYMYNSVIVVVHLKGWPLPCLRPSVCQLLPNEDDDDDEEVDEDDGPKVGGDNDFD